MSKAILDAGARQAMLDAVARQREFRRRLDETVGAPPTDQARLFQLGRAVAEAAAGMAMAAQAVADVAHWAAACARHPAVDAAIADSLREMLAELTAATSQATRALDGRAERSQAPPEPAVDDGAVLATLRETLVACASLAAAVPPDARWRVHDYLGSALLRWHATQDRAVLDVAIRGAREARAAVAS